jgi:hypothetical protein
MTKWRDEKREIQGTGTLRYLLAEQMAQNERFLNLWGL